MMTTTPSPLVLLASFTRSFRRPMVFVDMQLVPPSTPTFVPCRVVLASRSLSLGGGLVFPSSALLATPWFCVRLLNFSSSVFPPLFLFKFCATRSWSVLISSVMTMLPSSSRSPMRPSISMLCIVGRDPLRLLSPGLHLVLPLFHRYLPLLVQPSLHPLLPPLLVHGLRSFVPIRTVVRLVIPLILVSRLVVDWRANEICIWPKERARGLTSLNLTISLPVAIVLTRFYYILRVF